jgi:hypothetical protein
VSQVRTGTVRTKVPARLDRLPWSRWHWMIIIGLGTVWILDGLEVPARLAESRRQHLIFRFRSAAGVEAQAEPNGEEEMSLPVAQERTLTSIEQALRSRDPRLNSLFSIFTRLTRHEAMPTIEQIRQRHWRPQPGAVVLATIALLVCAIVLGSLGSGRGCGHTPTASTQRSAIAASAAFPQCASHELSGPKTP